MRSHKNDIKKTIVSFLLLKVVLHMYYSLFGTTIKLENVLIACVYLRFITFDCNSSSKHNIHYQSERILL